MVEIIQIDAAGRLVVPKAMLERLNLVVGATLRVDVVAGRIELTPVADATRAVLTRKVGITVVKRVGAKVDAAASVGAEREALEKRAAEVRRT